MAGEQAQVWYSGRVQGVGFRYTALSLARVRGVGGWVRNLADGRVELLARGERRRVEDFLASLESELSRNIRARRIVWSSAANKETDFVIRY